jgi:hypothetical protein
MPIVTVISRMAVKPTLRMIPIVAAPAATRVSGELAPRASAEQGRAIVRLVPTGAATAAHVLRLPAKVIRSAEPAELPASRVPLDRPAAVESACAIVRLVPMGAAAATHVFPLPAKVTRSVDRAGLPAPRVRVGRRAVMESVSVAQEHVMAAAAVISALTPLTRLTAVPMAPSVFRAILFSPIIAKTVLVPAAGDRNAALVNIVQPEVACATARPVPVGAAWVTSANPAQATQLAGRMESLA